MYSVGIILYCLVSGTSPFKGKTYREVLENNKKGNFSFEASIWTKISQECKNIITKLLE